VPPVAVLALALALPGAPQRVLVLDVGGVVLTKSEAGLVRDALAKELQTRPKLQVLTTEDMRRVLDVEAEKQATGCDTGADACIAELAGALGASRVLHATASRLGPTYVLSVVLVDPRSARALGRTTVEADSVTELVACAPDAVDEIVPPPPPPVITVAGAVTTGLGVVGAAGTGVALGVLYGATQDPDGDPAWKQAFLDASTPLTIGVIAAAGIALVGVVVLCVGVIVE
jgi:hypothetical protein